MTRNEIAYLFDWSDDDQLQHAVTLFPQVADAYKNSTNRQGLHNELVKLPKELLLSIVGTICPGGSMQDIEACFIKASTRSKVGSFDACAILASELGFLRRARSDLLRIGGLSAEKQFKALEFLRRQRTHGLAE